MIQNEPTLAFTVSGNGTCILSVEFLFNFFLLRSDSVFAGP